MAFNTEQSNIQVAIIFEFYFIFNFKYNSLKSEIFSQKGDAVIGIVPKISSEGANSWPRSVEKYSALFDTRAKRISSFLKTKGYPFECVNAYTKVTL